MVFHQPVTNTYPTLWAPADRGAEGVGDGTMKQTLVDCFTASVCTDWCMRIRSEHWNPRGDPHACGRQCVMPSCLPPAASVCTDGCTDDLEGCSRFGSV